MAEAAKVETISKPKRKKRERKSTLQIPPRFLALEDAATYLGLAGKTFRNMLCPKAKHRLPFRARKIGRKSLFSLVELDAYADSLETEK